MVSSRGAQAPEAAVALPEHGANEEPEWDYADEEDTSDSAEFFASDDDSEVGDDQVMTTYELGQELARLKGIWEEPRSRCGPIITKSWLRAPFICNFTYALEAGSLDCHVCSTVLARLPLCSAAAVWTWLLGNGYQSIASY